MLNNNFLMSKRRQANLLAHFGFTKKSKTNNSEEQQEAGSSADHAFFRATDTTAAPAGKPSACESPPTPGIQRLEMGSTAAQKPLMVVTPPASLSRLWYFRGCFAHVNARVTLVVFPKYLIFVWQTLHTACVFSSFPSSS